MHVGQLVLTIFLIRPCWHQQEQSEPGWIAFSVTCDNSFFESFIADSPSRSSINIRPVEAKHSD